MDVERAASEIQPLLQSGSALLYYSPNRLSTNLLPGQLAALDLHGLKLAVLIERMASLPTYTLQTARDASKTLLELVLESFVPSAALYTLRGVSSVVMMQWHTPARDAKCILSELAHYYLSPTSQQANIGSAIRSLASVQLAPIEPVPSADSLPPKSPGAGATKPGDSKTPKASPKKGQPAPSNDPPHVPIISDSLALRHATVLFGLPNVTYI